MCEFVRACARVCVRLCVLVSLQRCVCILRACVCVCVCVSARSAGMRVRCGSSDLCFCAGSGLRKLHSFVAVLCSFCVPQASARICTSLMLMQSSIGDQSSTVVSVAPGSCSGVGRCKGACSARFKFHEVHGICVADGGVSKQTFSMKMHRCALVNW